MESITFSRSVALGKTLIALSAVLFGIYLILAPEQGELGWFAPFYYILIFVLSIYFFGPAFCKLTVLLFSKTTIISFNQYCVTARDGRFIPWSDIKRIEVVEDTVNKLGQPVSRLYRFILLDRSHVDMSTYHLLTNQQFTDGAKKLRTAWSQNKHRKVEK
ncbi:hypothetical protein [Paenibacillus tundrae]|nr:hypothetical protein [Paenibacillus tundrae]